MDQSESHSCCRYPAAGSLVDVTALDALGHVHCLLFGNQLDTECLRSWAHADTYLVSTIPAIDKRENAMKGAGSQM